MTATYSCGHAATLENTYVRRYGTGKKRRLRCCLKCIRSDIDARTRANREKRDLLEPGWREARQQRKRASNARYKRLKKIGALVAGKPLAAPWRAWL